ncbi:tRNA (adenosine(37)-N6)-threonylcarbamoyltransferase complex transferase subunit TsaD [Candidatus Daviesbacteria bacterium]|nr:tRNA (adenosine(37)-N6)-threonylcarbamoyltransferase complex transferase subunit TsaD [Candidatus Daviesbacteria bacterium]
MIILGIETTCDETGAAVLQQKNDRIQILSNVVASSASLQAKYGGIIPEQAAREQIKSIIPVIQEAIENCKLKIENLDAISVSHGPGLIGSLLVGVETAKTLALVWNKPLIPVNHLIGHFYANWIGRSSPKFPCIGLLVSGGHTDLVLFQNHGKYKYLGGTRDDAAGECFDKCARLLRLPYPGGPEISKLAEKGSDIYKLPRPMMDSGDFDFSFSGLKTAVANLIQNSEFRIQNLAASIEAAIVDVLVAKTILAGQKYQVEQIMVAGGVAANQKLVCELKLKIENLKLKITLHVPSAHLCTDNAAMIAAAAFFIEPISDPLKLQADPSLALKY